MAPLRFGRASLLRLGAGASLGAMVVVAPQLLNGARLPCAAMADETPPAIVELAVHETYDLRWRVLRDGTPSDDVAYPEDTEPGTFHLGARDGDGTPIATATFCVVATPARPGASAVQLRGMAVDPAAQQRGVGRHLVLSAIERVRADGVDVLWASARDTALGFYERLGMEVVGDGYLTDDTQLPHHVVVLDLAR